MGWTPPTKFTVFISFLLSAFGLFIVVDLIFLGPDDYVIVQIDVKIGDFTQYETWGLIAIIVLFLSWFIFYLGVRLAGL